MKTQHTPGPWTYIYNGTCLELKGNCGNTLIAEFPSLEAIEGVAWKPGPEDSANLQLIAAAPDLLKVCLDCVKQMEQVFEKDLPEYLRNPFTNALIGARNAIVKATGGE